MVEKEDLIKKLEKIEFPKVELPTHKERLKNALVNWKYNQKNPSWILFYNIKKMLVPAIATAIVFCMIFLTINVLFSEDAYAKAKKIAMQDSQIRGWIEEGAEIKDMVVERNNAYILITPASAKTKPEETLKKEDFSGVLVKIELKEKRVAGIENINLPVAPLTDAEKGKAQDIVAGAETLTAPTTLPNLPALPQQIEFKRIEPIPDYDNLKLIKKNGGVKVSTSSQETERVKIIYEIDGEKKEGEINLKEQKIESLKTINSDETDKRSPKE